MSRDYLAELLDLYWFAPPVALWRAIELRTASQERFDRPILDLGCGDGLVAQALFGRNGTVDVGSDPWVEQLRQARTKGAYRHLDLASGQHLPYVSSIFATVFSNSVLEHVPDPVPLLRETGRVLRRGGSFIFTVPSDRFRVLLDGYLRRTESGDQRGAEAYANGVDRRLAHYHYYSPAEWRQLMSTEGLTLERWRYYIAGEVVRLWDRANRRFGIGERRSAWSVFASPRFRGTGYQLLLRRLIVRRYSYAWRRPYLMDVGAGEPGGGLLVIARKSGGL